MNNIKYSPLIYKILQVYTAKAMLKGKAVTIWQVSALSYDDKNNNTYSVKLTSVKDFQLKIDCKYKMGFNIKNAYQIEEAELVGNDIIEFKKTNVKFRADIDN